jgi:hypothetical protein
LAVGVSITLGIAVGIGLGSLAILADSLWWILFLGIPLGIRLIGAITGRLTFRDRTLAWTWPIVALVVAVSVPVLLPRGLAPVGLGVAVGLWFATLIVGGILEVVVDPEGRLGV